MKHPENTVSSQIIDAAIQVHRILGPGLLESVYERALVYELEQMGLRVSRQVSIDIVYKDARFSDAFRADIVVENLVLIEVKALDVLLEVHRRQTNTYVRLMNLRLGLLLNFGGIRLKDGIVRIANGMPEER